MSSSKSTLGTHVDGLVDSFWEIVCGFIGLVHMMWVTSIALFVLLLVAFPFIDAGTTAGLIALIDLVLLGVAIPVLTAILWKCRRS